jgi:hypothetical protein
MVLPPRIERSASRAAISEFYRCFHHHKEPCQGNVGARRHFKRGCLSGSREGLAFEVLIFATKSANPKFLRTFISLIRKSLLGKIYGPK